MFIYFMNLLLIPLNAVILKFLNVRDNRKIVTISFIHLYALLAFRGPAIGYDTFGYIELFNRTKLFDFMDFEYSRHEAGFLLLNKFLSFIENQQMFIAILALIPLVLIFRFIFKESKIPWLSIYLFITMGFYTNSFNQLRQIVALSIVTISYKYLKESKFIKFLISVIVAGSFHITALVFLPIYFFKTNRLNYKNFLIYMSLGIFIVTFGESIVKLGLSIFSSVYYEIESGGGVLLLFTMVLILLAGLLFKDSVLLKSDKSIILYNILIFAILTQLFALDFALFTRVASYFRIFVIIFIPCILDAIRDKKLRIIGIFLVMILTAVQYYIELKSDFSGIVPYIFFWQ